MKMTKYLRKKKPRLHVARGSTIETSMIVEAIERTHQTMDRFDDFDVNVFELLGMRNLSAFVGEVFAASLRHSAGGMFEKNPHQDGYPDLLLMDTDGKRLWSSLSHRMKEKEPFSPFATGGVEVKATCGNTPPAKVLRKRGQEKPGIGDTRISLLNGYDWKAHHRETNHLLSILWYFQERRPTVAAVFYSYSLTVDDWGKIVSPKAGGGRTTSVSIMNTKGRRKMYEGWIVCIDNPSYIDFLNRKNSATLIG